MAEAARVLIHNATTAEMASRLRETFPQVEVLECDTYEGLPAMLSQHRPNVVYSVRFDGGAPFPKDALLGPDGPQWIANGGAGTDHFGHWDTARVTMTNAAGVAADMIAEYVMGGFLHFTLDAPGLLADKAQRVWAGRIVRPLKGQTLMVVGLGSTGRAVAARAKAFGMHVIGTRRRPQQMENVDEVGGAEDFHAMLPRADFIAVSTPLTTETRGLLGEREFALMKPGVILADVSRGCVIDGTALLDALRSGKVAAAALDVFETEPLPADSPFWTQANVLVSPHCSAVTEEWERASFEIFLRNLGHWLRGEPLFNVVDPDLGY